MSPQSTRPTLTSPARRTPSASSPPGRAARASPPPARATSGPAPSTISAPNGRRTNRAGRQGKGDGCMGGELTLAHFLILSALLFVIGMLGVLTRKNVL